MGLAPLLVEPKPFEDLYLYLAVCPHVVSSVLVRREGSKDQLIYFTSRTLLPSQSRYLPLEKLTLALITTTWKLPPYFQEHSIIVLTEFPIKNLLRKANLSSPDPGKIPNGNEMLGQLRKRVLKELRKSTDKGMRIQDIQGFLCEIGFYLVCDINFGIGGPLPQEAKSREGRTASRSTRSSKSHRREESVAHSKSVHYSEDLLDKKRQEIEGYARLMKKQEYEIRKLEQIWEHPEDSGLSQRNSRENRYAMVKHKKAPSRGRKSRSRSPTPRRYRASSQKEGSRTQERWRASSRKRRSSSTSPTSKEDKTRMHHRERYERPESDWNRAGAHKTKE
ncbi:uncharacterized protein LOC131306873 [Rhododendron vialii]|uniref:uncharacterized protein LOC131306873 n=1 Tax=Rhododendron vialii TaxID=182163 RepID=UPI00265F1610|nr:uncharacterized protein LOC131306873 [Rhododendron vialii]